MVSARDAMSLLMMWALALTHTAIPKRHRWRRDRFSTQLRTGLLDEHPLTHHHRIVSRHTGGDT